MEVILDAEGRPMTSIPKFEDKTDTGEVCITGYQGFAQHSPFIQSYAQKNPENFAQTLLFAPLTANTKFSHFNEWFPVLIKWLKTKNKITREELGNFIAGVGAQRSGKIFAKDGDGSGTHKGKIFAMVADMGAGFKTRLVEEVWNNRDSLYSTSMQLADSGDYEGLMRLFSRLPGIAPIKAGFVVQLLFGRLGCIDTHNTRMYKAVADLVQNTDMPEETKKKWRELKRMIEAGKGWQPSDKQNEKLVDKAVAAYKEVLDFMFNELGMTSETLWNAWVNYVAKLYEGDDDNVYSSEQGLSHAPDDPAMLKAFGGKDWEWLSKKQKKDFLTNIIEPHPASGGVSRVHLMAAIDPDELLDNFPTKIGDKFHVINASLRSDPNAKHALEALSDRIMNQVELDEILGRGERRNKVLAKADEENVKKFEQMKINAKDVLKKYLKSNYKMNDKNAGELIDMYSMILKNNYENSMKNVRSLLMSRATRGGAEKITDDELEGFKMHQYDPSDIPAHYGEKMARGIDPVKEPLLSAVQMAKLIEKLTKEKAALSSQLETAKKNMENIVLNLASEKDAELSKQYLNDKMMIEKSIKSLKKRIENKENELIAARAGHGLDVLNVKTFGGNEEELPE